MEQERKRPPVTNQNSKKVDNLDSAKKRLKRKVRNGRIKALLIVLFLLIIGLWLVFDKLFVVKKIKVIGQNTYTDAQAVEIAEEMGIHLSDHLFAIDKIEAKELARYRLPQFDSIEISFDMPDTVVLSVTEATPVMYIIFGDRGYSVSESLRVIKGYSDPAECESLGLARLELNGITKCVVGEYLETSGTEDELAKKLYSIFKEEGIAGDVTTIDVTQKYDITFEYKKQFRVLLGNENNLTVKVRYMKAIAEKLKKNDSGVIDVSDEECKDATFKPYNKM